MNVKFFGMFRIGLVIVSFLTLFTPVFSQPVAGDVKTLIDSIRNAEHLYLFGDATKKNRESASKEALEMLDNEVRLWIRQQQDVQLDEEAVDNIIGNNTVLKSMKRGDCWRYFLYIPKSVFKGVAVEQQEPLVATVSISDVQPSVSGATYSGSTSFTSEVLITEYSGMDNLQLIRKCETIVQLKECLRQLKEQDIPCEYIETGCIRDANNVFLVLFRRNGMIEAILAPGSGKERTNILTETKDNVNNHPACVSSAFKFE
ncbi:MAG: hypothetical protein J6S82_03755 [Bacteroidales bacterium]|nr:hypothetical protein [Bacteroidales bacterium]